MSNTTIGKKCIKWIVKGTFIFIFMNINISTAKDFDSATLDPMCVTRTCVEKLPSSRPLVENEWKILAIGQMNELRKEIRGLKENSGFDWAFFLSCLSTIASLASCYLVWVIAKDLTFKRNIREKQLDTVCSLVNELQKLKLYFKYKFTKSVGDVYFPIFEMSIEKFKSLNWLEGQGDYEVYVSSDFLYKNNIFSYVNNPLLPKSIADALINLYPRGGGNRFEYTNKNSSVFISDARNYTEQTFTLEVSRYYKSLNLLFESTESLAVNIDSWLKLVDVTDLNIRRNLINNDNYP